MFTLETERLLLRNIHAEDAKDIFEFFSDEQTCLDDGGYHAASSMADKNFLSDMEYLVSADEHYGVVLKSENKVVGMVHIMKAERGVEARELGFIMNKNYRRQGIISEAARAVMDVLAASGVKLLVATAYEYNFASVSTLESLGFVKEGVIHKSLLHPQKGLINSLQFYRDI